jgi:deoxyribose-phosphate aldolase
MNKRQLAGLIDHTILKPEASMNEVKRVCLEALKYGFASVCINPCYVKYAADILKDSNVKVCTVIGFPLGANTTKVKAFEALNAIEDGAEEIDMVINVGALKNKDYEYVYNDIKAVVDAAKDNALVKVIIEACLLTDDEKIMTCNLSKNAGTDFVKTSTGFSSGGAKPCDIKLMRETVGDKMGVKASGGVRTYADAKEMIESGASRIGASSSIKIIEECEE